MKKQMLLICLALVLIPLLYAQEEKKSQPSFAAALGIESEKSYSGKVVIELIDAVETEAETAIKKAFEEGYKAGIAEYKPEAVRLAALNESLLQDLKKELRKSTVPTWSLPLAGFLSFAGGVFAGAFISR